MLDKFLQTQSPEVVAVVQFLRRKISMLEATLIDRDRLILELDRKEGCNIFKLLKDALKGIAWIPA